MKRASLAPTPFRILRWEGRKHSNIESGLTPSVLDRLRGRVGAASDRMGRGAARAMPSPTAWTATGLVFSLLAAFLFSLGTARYDLLAGVAVLVSGFFDIVDGAVARATGRVSRRGAFLDSTMDRVGETSIYLGILVGGAAPAVLVFLALAASLLVSYARAKADALAVNLAGVGIGERSERLIVIALAALLDLVPYGVLVVAGLAIVTFGERVIRVTRALK
jgi:archaetidylinositol phosphate synthase